MDGPTESIAVAYVAQAHDAEVVSLGTSGPRQGDLDTLLRQLHSTATPLLVVDAGGPCGSWRYRPLTQPGHDGWGGAPSCMPHTAGDRVTPDRRAARQLARLMRAGDLTPVDVPQGDDEASRERSRARAERLRDLTAATDRLTACRLRHDLRDTGQAHGSPAPRRWRAAVVCPTPAPQIVRQEYGRTVPEHAARLQRLAQALQERVTPWRLAPVVEARPALRGVQCTVAVTTVAARGDLTRLTTPKQLLRDLGLTPSAAAREASPRPGLIMPAGP